MFSTIQSSEGIFFVGYGLGDGLQCDFRDGLTGRGDSDNLEGLLPTLEGATRIWGRRSDGRQLVEKTL